MLIFATSAYSDPEPIESFLRLASHGKRHHLTASVDKADAILFVENSRYHEDPFFSRLKHHPFVKHHRERCFMYNEHDRPWGLLPGLYCSMPRRWFERTRQRATRYVRLLNPVDTSPSDQPDVLFSFVGNAQIPLRREILRLQSPRAILEDTSSFNAFFAKEHTSNHARYAEVLRRSKFVLCPRGSGTSSIRLFETLRVGRVPIIISDQWVAPEGPDWSSCSLRVQERNIAAIERLALDAEPRWSEMADAAKQVWSDWFSDEVLFDRFGDALAAIAERRVIPEFVAQRIPSIPELDWRLRRGIHHLSSRLCRRRRTTRRGFLGPVTRHRRRREPNQRNVQ
jgi:Exostosin family